MTAEPIVAFLKARYDDREAQARSDIDHFDDPGAANPEPRGQWIVKTAREVLRDIEANRLLLDEHAIANDSVCGTCVTGRWGYPTHGGADPQPYPCRTLRLHALPHSDHPDFDPDWSA